MTMNTMKIIAAVTRTITQMNAIPRTPARSEMDDSESVLESTIMIGVSDIILLVVNSGCDGDEVNT